jgi:hypothetical protein
MKKLIFVPLAAFALLFAACSETSTEAMGPQFQLVDESLRLTTGNADVIATFEYTIAGEPGIIINAPGINSEGKEIGWCNADGTGRWLNPSSKKYAAKLPHDHCVTTSTASRVVRLEQITSKYESKVVGQGHTVVNLYLSNQEDSFKVVWNSNGGNIDALGVIHARAIDQNNVVWGKFVFDLADFGGSTNHFAEYEHSTEGGGTCVFGLNKTIYAQYWAPGATAPTASVPGKLYWEGPASCTQ